MKKINVELTTDKCDYIIAGLRNIISGMRNEAVLLYASKKSEDRNKADELFDESDKIADLIDLFK